MQMLFLGTGAADGVDEILPADFNNKDFRRCSSALLDGKILLDCGPHILNSLAIAGVDPANITDIVLTHLHYDHFNAESVNAIASANTNLRLWCREGAVFETAPKCQICYMSLFCEYNISDYNITGVPANHTAYPQHLSIEKDGKKLFYGIDGAWYLGETVEFMKKQNYNTFIFDATVGDYIGDHRIGEHNSIPMIRLLAASLKTIEATTESTNLILTHRAMCLHKTHEETTILVKQDGFIIAYDGMKFEF